MVGFVMKQISFRRFSGYSQSEIILMWSSYQSLVFVIFILFFMFFHLFVIEFITLFSQQIYSNLKFRFYISICLLLIADF